MYTVYLIENTVNHKLYVGVTSNTLENRWKQHCVDSKRSDYAFHNAIQKHGKENFETFVLEKTYSEKKALELEKCYISKFETYSFGYNSTKGGDGFQSGEDHRLAKYSDEEVVEIVNEYRTTDKTRKQVAEEYDITIHCLDSWNKGQNRSELQTEFEEEKDDKISDDKVVKFVVQYKTTEVTQKQLANECGVSPSTFSSWVTGDARNHLQEKVTARIAYHYM